MFTLAILLLIVAIIMLTELYPSKIDNEEKLIKEIHRLRREIMATKEEVLQAIADERQQVLAAVDALNVQIQALKDQIEAGTAVTAADLDDIVTAVNDIFIPPTA
jgi:hypothetical protein